jgi:serine/threonine protein kinase
VLQENIVDVLDVFESNDHTFIVMELMSGGSLASRLFDAKKNYLDEGSVRGIAYQLLLALEYLHFENVIHRDIKPANILMASDKKFDNRVKLADFGLSTLVSGSMLALSKVGTENYMAPEVRRRNGMAYTSKVDVWSLGATIHVW